MIHRGACPCATWTLRVSTDQALEDFRPRVCDCEYCKDHPSALISDSTMRIEVFGDGAFDVHQNGDRLADFYHCKACGVLIAVGRVIDGQRRGAANGMILDGKASLGAPVPIQPRLLSSTEKLSRWKTLWGTLELPKQESSTNLPGDHCAKKL